MKNIQIIAIVLLSITFTSCKKVIDILPQSNLYAEDFYKNEAEVKIGLTACYNGLQAPLSYEWQMTELRSDNTKMGSAGSISSINRDFSDLDIFMPATTHQATYLYWLSTYNNIKNANTILQRLGVVYNPSTGTHTYNNIGIDITDSARKQLAGEAMFIRAYHYFNLVRLYGKVFLVHTPISASEAKGINRSPVEDVYKLIEADLKFSKYRQGH
jgi:starch-binding outer membrane protein, SusD/RagB family